MTAKQDANRNKKFGKDTTDASLGMSELLRELPVEAQKDAEPGEIIKPAGAELPHAFVLVAGLVRVERDIMTPSGVKSVVVDTVNRDELFNTGAMFSAYKPSERQNRYVAETRCVYLTLTLQNLKGVGSLTRVLWGMLVAKIKRSIILQNALAAQLEARANDSHTARLEEESVNGRNIQKLTQELQNLQRAREEDQKQISRLQDRVTVLNEEVEKLTDAAWDDPAKKAEVLERKVEELSDAINSERADATLARNVLEAKLELLEPVARQKAHDAWTALSQSESVVKAAQELSNFIHGLLAKAKVTLNDEEVARYRELLQQISWRFSEQIFAKLTDDNFLTEKDVRSLSFLTVEKAETDNADDAPDSSPKTQRLPILSPNELTRPKGAPISAGSKARVSAPMRRTSRQSRSRKDENDLPLPPANDTNPYDLESGTPPDEKD